MNDALSCWGISDGRRGIENQVLGLAEAIARIHPLNTEQKTLSLGGAFKAAQPGLQLTLKSKPENYGFLAPFPSIALGCGRQAIAPLRALKKKCGSDIFTVYIQDPRTSSRHFDLVIAPEHDELAGDNVFKIIGSPNRVTNDRIIVDTLKFERMISALPSPRIAMLIGGSSKSHRLDETSHAAHMRAANALLDQGHSLMVTTSRRTPEFVKTAFQNLASRNVKVWFDDGTGENPYFALLGASEAILVTEDSTNMLTEACATGKPVFTLPMSGSTGKFNKLYARLDERCNVTRFSGIIDAPHYDALNETARAAQEVLDRYKTSRSGSLVVG